MFIVTLLKDSNWVIELSQCLTDALTYLMFPNQMSLLHVECRFYFSDQQTITSVAGQDR